MKPFVFVCNAFDLETTLVPGVEDSACATFTDCVAKVSLSPRGWVGGALVGVGVGVGVRVVGWRVANELMDEELLVSSVLSEVI